MTWKAKVCINYADKGQDMKTEMKMLDNGNYESVVSPIQHQCRSECYILECVEYGWDMGKLHLKIEDGDPYEDGYALELLVKYCPFCGYQPERLSGLESEMTMRQSEPDNERSGV